MRLASVFPSQMLATGGGAAGGAAPRQIVIPFRVQPQLMTQWCWAAVTASVVAYLAPRNASTWTQCMVASAELREKCCQDPAPCNVTNVLDRPLKRVGHLRHPIISSYIRPPAIATELDAALPVAIRVQWASGGGHFLCIFGIADTGRGVKLALTDPIFGEGAIMGDALINGGYQSSGGSWSHTYVLQP